MTSISVRDLEFYEAGENSAKSELQRYEEFYEAAVAKMVTLKAVHEYECPCWRNGKRWAPCNCGGAERQARIDKAIAAIVKARKGDGTEDSNVPCHNRSR